MSIALPLLGRIWIYGFLSNFRVQSYLAAFPFWRGRGELPKFWDWEWRTYSMLRDSVPLGGCWRGVTGEREAFLEGSKKQTEASKFGAVQRVRWDGGVYTCQRPWTPPRPSSYPVFLEMEIGPFFPFSYVAWSPSPSLVLTYFRPLSQTLACCQDFGSKFSPFPLVLEPLDKNSQSRGVGLCWNGWVSSNCTSTLAPQNQWLGSHAVWRSSHFSVTRLWIISKRIFYYCYYGSLFWNKNSECIYNITGLAFLFCFGPSCDNKISFNPNVATQYLL